MTATDDHGATPGAAAAGQRPGQVLACVCTCTLLVGRAVALAREVATDDVTANAVCPGPTDTPALRKFADNSGQDADRVIGGMTRAVAGLVGGGDRPHSGDQRGGG